MIPIGNTGIQPDPLGSLSKLIGLQSAQVGLQQQRQNLQTGQYQQATAQAEAQGAQRTQAEQQAAQQLMINGTKPGGKYVISSTDPATGKVTQTLDRQAMANDINTVAPTTGQSISQSLLSQANEIVQNQQAVQNLTSSKRALIGSTVGALSSDPTVDHSKVIDAFEGIRKQYPEDGELSRLLQSAGGAIPPNASGPALQPILNRMASMMTGQAATAPGTTAAGQNINRGTFSGQNVMPTGNAPNPTTPQVAGQTGRATGNASADINVSNNVVAAQRDARTNIDLTRRIDQLADLVDPGALPAKVSQGLGALGLQDVNQARSELQKDLGRLRGPFAARAGSDERAKEVLDGLPTDATPTQTIHQAMDFTRGTSWQDLALGQLQSKSSSATSGNMNGFQGDYAHSVAAASPLMHEYMHLTPQQQVGFFQRNFHTKEQAQAFRAQAESVKKMSPDVFGQ